MEVFIKRVMNQPAIKSIGRYLQVLSTMINHNGDAIIMRSTMPPSKNNTPISCAMYGD
jgi:hypothetical protein